MPDLSLNGSHQFWKNYIDPIIYRVVTFMEGVEHWTHDGDPVLEEAIDRLGMKLDAIGDVELGEEDAFIKVSTHIKSSRSLRLLQTLDSARPGAASKLLIHAEEITKENEFGNPIHSLFLRRNMIFERLRLLTRVFSQYRLSQVMKALEGEDD